MVGGQRTFGPDGAIVAVTTKSLTIDNAGTPLTGSDLILVSKEKLTLADGAEVRGTGGGVVEDSPAR